MKIQTPKVAIVTSWISGVGGSERLVYQLHRQFPEAPIYTATYEPDGSKLFKHAQIKTSWMQRLPKFMRRHQLLTLPRQWHFGHMKLRGYDVVISAGSSEEKAILVVSGKHINICYTPTLYYWIKPDNYLGGLGSDSVNPLWRLGLKIMLPAMKRWDRKAARRPDKMYAISTVVQTRIKKFYGRNSEILFPPADLERFETDGNQKREGFVVFGRQVTHKRIDLAIAACNELSVNLTVVGDGPEHERLMRMAGPTIAFKSNVSDDEMVRYIGTAKAFLFPNEEDFGIVAVEAQAAGTPVIAYRGGGALDTVVEGVTGEFFNEQTVDSLSRVIKNFNYKLYNRQAILQNAERFSNENFAKNVAKAVDEIISK